MLTRRRLRAHSGLVSGIAAVIVLLSVVLGGMLASVSEASVAAARQSLADAPPADGAIRIAIRLADDPALVEEQDATVRAEVLAALGGSGAGLVTITRDVIATELSVATATDVRSVAIVSDASIAAGGPPAEGEWPSATATMPEIAVPAEFADALDVAVGDSVELPASDDETVTFIVSGIIDSAPASPSSSDSDSDSGADSGADRAAEPRFPVAADGAAPLVIAEKAFALLDTRPIARWTVAPDLSRLSAGAVDALAAGLPGLAAAIDEAPGARSQGVVIEGGLAGTLTGIRAEAGVAAAILPVPLLLVAGAGVLAALELARSLAAARADEVSLLRSRGASARQLIRAAAIDWMLIAAPSAVAGAAAGVLLVPAAVGLSSASPTATDLALITAVAAAVAVTVAAAGIATASRAALAPLQRESLGAERRERRALDAGVLLLVVVLAIIAFVAFQLAGGPVRLSARGELVVDPIAVLAPALVIFAAALIGGAALRPLLGLIAGSMQGRRGPGAAIGALQLARRATAFAVPALLVAVAVGGGIVAAAYDATASAAREAARALALGADVRVSAIDDDRSAEVLAALRELRGASGADAAASTPAVTAVLEVADRPVDLVAVDARSAAVSDGRGTLDLAALREAVAPGSLPVIEMPAGASEVRVSVRASPAVPVETVIWVMDAQGAVVRLVAAPAGGTAGDTATAQTDGIVVAALPDGPTGTTADARWRLVAIDVRPVPKAMPEDGVVVIAVGDVVAATGAAETPEPLVAGAPWGPRAEATRSFPGTIVAVEPGDEPTGAAALESVLAAVRIEATRRPDQPVRLMAEPGIPPIAITPALAERTALRTDDELRARTASVGRPVVGRVAGTVAAIPGGSGDEAIVVDLAAFTLHQLATTSTPLSADQVWLAADAAGTSAAGDGTGGGANGGAGEAAGGIAAIVADLERAAPGAVVDAVALPPAAPLLDAVRAALQAAAASVALLAIASVVASSSASRRQRASEVVVLRALGRSAALQARDRAVELGVLLVLSSAIGTGAGALVVATTVRDLAGAVVLGAPAALRLEVALAAAAVGVGALVVAAVILAVAALHGLAVAGQARRLSPGVVLR